MRDSGVDILAIKDKSLEISSFSLDGTRTSEPSELRLPSKPGQFYATSSGFYEILPAYSEVTIYTNDKGSGKWKSRLDKIPAERFALIAQLKLKDGKETLVFVTENPTTHRIWMFSSDDQLVPLGGLERPKGTTKSLFALDTATPLLTRISFGPDRKRLNSDSLRLDPFDRYKSVTLNLPTRLSALDQACFTHSDSSDFGLL